MSTSRNPLFAAAASLPLLALLAVSACSSAPTESTGSSESNLYAPVCPAGETWSCKTVLGKQVCSCVYAPPPPPRCVLEPDVFTTTGVSDENNFVAAWAVLTATGTCTNLPGNGGTWEPIQDGYVPGDNEPLANTCALAFPYNPSCCTYVWWPDASAMQDPSALCTPNTLSYAAIVQLAGFQCPPADPHCGGGAKCDYCMGE